MRIVELFKGYVTCGSRTYLVRSLALIEAPFKEANAIAKQLKKETRK